MEEAKAKLTEINLSDDPAVTLTIRLIMQGKEVGSIIGKKRRNCQTIQGRVRRENQHIRWILSGANRYGVRFQKCYLQSLYTDHKEVRRVVFTVPRQY